MKNIDTMTWLQNWYAKNCNGMWEQGNGVSISTIDNPGWRVKINLKDTFLEGKDVETKELEKNENDWIMYWVKNSIFEAAGGARNLTEILNIFRKWVEDGII